LQFVLTLPTIPPAGYLHIGHSKAIAVNFGYAQYHKGHCYLRYDDTNPEAEEQVYLDSILDIVRWLGYEPWKITYSSDNFQRLYDLAVDLIKRDKAYMCHCTGKHHSPVSPSWLARMHTDCVLISSQPNKFTKTEEEQTMVHVKHANIEHVLSNLPCKPLKI
jgi:glutamyl/glutaminyl-tRNA synthetase